MKIGVFDSGLGGLSVLHCLKKTIPNADYIYYADVEHVPYGEKAPEVLRTYIKNIFRFFLDRDVDAIVIACNTATSVIDKEYRSSFGIPIVGMEPAVKKAVELFGEEHKRILVAATPITIHGNKLGHLVEKVDVENETDLIALPGLVHYAEEGDFRSSKIVHYLRKELENYDIQQYGTIVLGCTHFNYFKESFLQIFGDRIHFVDGNEGTANQVKRLLLAKAESTTKGTAEYYFSGKKVNQQDYELIQNCLSQLERVYPIN